MFFQLDEKPSPTRPLNRQATLGMLLHVIEACEQTKVAATRASVDGDLVFWPHYYGGLEEPEGKFQPYRPHPVFQSVHEFWRQFCAHQFFAFAMEELLAAILEPLALHPEGLTRTALVEAMVTTEFADGLKTSVGAVCGSPSELLEKIGLSSIPDQESSISFSQRINTDSLLCEWCLCWDDEHRPDNRLARAILLMAVLYGRWRGQSNDAALASIEPHAQHEWWLGTLFEWIDRWHASEMTWASALGELIDATVMRHDTVKFQKRKLDASWLEWANGRFLKQQDITPDFRSSRHRNALTILQDLGLVKHSEPDEALRLTPRGREILQEVIRLRTS